MPPLPSHSANNAGHLYEPGVIEIHEGRVYRVYPPYRPPAEPNSGYSGAPNAPGPSSERGDSSNPKDGPDVIDTTYRVLS